MHRRYTCVPHVLMNDSTDTTQVTTTSNISQTTQDISQSKLALYCDMKCIIMIFSASGA